MLQFMPIANYFPLSKVESGNYTQCIIQVHVLEDNFDIIFDTQIEILLELTY